MIWFVAGLVGAWLCYEAYRVGNHRGWVQGRQHERQEKAREDSIDGGVRWWAIVDGDGRITHLEAQDDEGAADALARLSQRGETS